MESSPVSKAFCAVDGLHQLRTEHSNPHLEIGGVLEQQNAPDAEKSTTVFVRQCRSVDLPKDKMLDLVLPG
jgi:hypothetical protein